VELNDHLTDAEILRAIRYLDPDPCAEETQEERGTAVGICITLLAAQAIALTLIYLRMRGL
jgi:hypothetical protein